MTDWMELYQQVGRIAHEVDETGAYEEDPQARKATEGLLVAMDALATIVHRLDEPDADEVDSFEGQWVSLLQRKYGVQVGDPREGQ